MYWKLKQTIFQDRTFANNTYFYLQDLRMFESEFKLNILIWKQYQIKDSP